MRRVMSKKSDFDRRRFVRVTAAAVAAGPLGLFGRVNAMTQALTDVAQPTSSGQTEIRPFRFTASDADLTDLRRRINATKWPEREIVNDQSQGVQLSTMQNLARYWGTQYDWRKCEARLVALPQFTTTIDGVDIHFIHVRSKEKNALPVIVTHGWPGSIIEQLKIIDPLTNPTAYGGSASEAFDVVIPSMPGYGFSGKPTTTGWDQARIARAWAVLMKRLARAFDGEPTGLTRDDVLDNATLFWVTNTTISAARLYWEGFAKTNLGPKNVSIPVAVSVFPDDVIPAPRSWAERAYPRLIHYNQLDKGGHFAAWEQPKLLVDEMRAGFKSVR